MKNIEMLVNNTFVLLKTEMEEIFQQHKAEIVNFFHGYIVEEIGNKTIFKVKKDKTQLLFDNAEDLFQNNPILKLNEISINYELNRFMVVLFSVPMKKLDSFLLELEEDIDIELLKEKESKNYLDERKIFFTSYINLIDTTFSQLISFFESKITELFKEYLLINHPNFNEFIVNEKFYEIEYPPLLRIDTNFRNFIKNFKHSIDGLSFLEGYSIKMQKKLFEENEELLRLKFNYFVFTILKLASSSIKNTENYTNDINLKFDASILIPNKKASLCEITTKFFVDTLSEKIPITKILDKMKNLEYSFFIKEYNINTLKNENEGNYIKVTLFFGYLNKQEKFYPVKISFDFENIITELPSDFRNQTSDAFILENQGFLSFILNQKKYLFDYKYLIFPKELKIKHRISPLPSNVFVQDIIHSFTSSSQKDKGIQKILNKDESVRSHDDIKKLTDFEQRAVKIEVISKYANPELNTKEIIIKNTPKNFFSIDIDEIKRVFEEENLSLNTIKLVRSNYGAVGLKYFLGLNYLLSTNSKNGRIFISLNDFLEIIGEKREKNGAFNQSIRLKASQIIRMFGSLTLKLSNFNNQVIRIKLFDLEVEYEKDKVLEKFILEAKEWYFKSFDKENQLQYTYILNKILEENEGEHSITISLYSLLSIRWRMKLHEKFKITTILDWLDIGYTTKEEIKNRFVFIHRLYKEIEYMKEKGYIKNYKITLDNKIIETKLNELTNDLFKSNYLIEFEPPDIIKEKIDTIHKKQESIIESILLPTRSDLKEEFKLVTKTDVMAILENGKLHEKLKKSHFAEKVGISRQYLDLFLKGERGISLDTSNKILEKYGYLLEE